MFAVMDRAIRHVRDSGAEAAVLSNTSRKAVRSLVARAIDEGWTDAYLRTRIATVAGLAPRDARAVENMRQGLVSEGLSPGRVKRQVDAYANRLRKRRAEVLGQTELRLGLNVALREQWAVQQENGDISPWGVRVLRVTKDERLCPHCGPLNGRRVSLRRGAGYDVPGYGFLPGPPFHPLCRCYEELRDEGVAKGDDTIWDPTISKDGSMDITCVDSAGREYESERVREAWTGISKGDLDRSPRKNWVEKLGGLPRFIERIAKHLHYERGMDISRAIATAISRCKVWAATSTNPETKAKAIEAIAQWTKMKAQAHA